MGLEDSKKSWKIAVRCDKRLIHRVSMEAKYPVLITYLRNKFPECTIHLIYEAGFKGFNLYDRLTEDGIDCVVIPPHMVTEPKVSRVKTDKRDANRLALVLENHDFKDACHVPDKERREDRQVTRTLIAIQKDIIRTRNRIRKFLHFHGIEVSLPDRWGRQEFRSLKKLSLSDPLRISLDVLLTQLEELWVHQTSLRAALRELCRKERYEKAFKIAKSLPGIGWFTAIRLVLELGEDLLPFHQRKEDRELRGTHLQRILLGRDRTERRHYRHGFGVHQSDPHRELVDGHPHGPGLACEVHAHMAGKRQQEEGDHRGGTDAHRTSSGMLGLRHAVRNRSGAIVTDETMKDKVLRLPGGTTVYNVFLHVDTCHAFTVC